MNYDLKNIFLELLEDKDIQEEIKKICEKKSIFKFRKEEKITSNVEIDKENLVEKDTLEEALNLADISKNLYEKLEEKYDSLEKEYNELKTVINVKENALQESSEKINSLEESLENIKEDKESLENKIKEVQSEKVGLESLLNKAKEELLERNKNIENMILEIKEVRNEKNSLKDQLNNEIIKNGDLKEQVNNISEELQNKNNQLGTAISENENSKKRLAKLIDFEKWTSIFENYNNLSEGTKNSLKGIFKGETTLDFIYCGVQENNMFNLWDYIKDRALNGSDEVETLEAIFTEFFNGFNKVYGEGIYKLQEVSRGEEFDDEYYIRTSNSKPSGEIERVILKGFTLKSNGKIIKKSIVEI